MRPKYVQANNQGIIIASMVDRPLPKAIVGPGLLAQIIIDKYVDHLPLYRQMERFKREGINIPYSTIGDWVKNGCTLIDPLYESLKKLIVRSNYLHADESPIKVLDKDKKGYYPSRLLLGISQQHRWTGMVRLPGRQRKRRPCGSTERF